MKVINTSFTNESSPQSHQDNLPSRKNMNPHLESRSKDSVFEVWIERWWFQPFFFQEKSTPSKWAPKKPSEISRGCYNSTSYFGVPNNHRFSTMYSKPAIFFSWAPSMVHSDPNSFHLDKDFFWVVLLQKAGVETTKMRPRCLKTVTKSGKSR